MNMSINFPHLGIYLDHVGKSITVFGFEIAYYGIVIAFGMLLAVCLISAEAKRTGQDDDFYFTTIMISIAVGVVGARLYYVAFSWDYYSQNPAEIFNIRHGGLAIYGGIIFGVITVCICGKVKKVRLSTMLDTMCIGLPLGQLIGRWGNFFNREAFGDYTDSLFAMQLPVDAVRQNEITQKMWEHVQVIDGVQYIQVHPTFLYESLWNLALLLFLLWLIRHKKWEGQVFMAYLGGYGLGRVWIEGMRTDQLLIPGIGLPVSQVLSAALVIVCVLWNVYQYRRDKIKCK